MHSTEDTSTTHTSSEIEGNPGYALGQLVRAFATSETHPEPEVRSRAQQKILRWIQVFQGMISGALHIGSRVPVARTPAWATLEVVTGGFATGKLLAGSALQPHEHDLLRRLPAVPAGGERVALNSYYLSDAGLDALRQMLASGGYRIRVPEEGALLVVAWLLDHGYADQARGLLDEIGPFVSRLRFYPVPAERPLAITTVVHRQAIGDMIRDLQALRMPHHRTPLAPHESVRLLLSLLCLDGEIWTEADKVGSSLRLPIHSTGRIFQQESGQPIARMRWHRDKDIGNPS